MTAEQLTLGSLFSGYGGLDLAVEAVTGARPVWFCEHEPPSPKNPRPSQAAARVLAHRWPDVPNLGDIQSIDWAGVPRVDLLSGGFPCTDLSLAGAQAGLMPGTRSGLWSYFASAIRALRPRLVFIENVRGILSAQAHSDVEPCPWCLGDAGDGEPPLRALGAVLADLADIGYDAVWYGLRAADVGAPHSRFRVFIVAWPALAEGNRGALPDASGDGWDERRPEPAGDIRRPDAAQRGDGSVADTGGNGLPRGEERDERQAGGVGASLGDDAAGRLLDWGPYADAIQRWERVLGRPAPPPTERGAKGQPRLAPEFVEWMMGLPAGHVTSVPGISRNDQLKALGNGVVPHQAAAALGFLLSFAPSLLEIP